MFILPRSLHRRQLRFHTNERSLRSARPPPLCPPLADAGPSSPTHPGYPPRPAPASNTFASRSILRLRPQWQVEFPSLKEPSMFESENAGANDSSTEGNRPMAAHVTPTAEKRELEFVLEVGALIKSTRDPRVWERLDEFES